MKQKIDSELIRKTLAGDRTAGHQLLERHRTSVMMTAYRALENWDDAWDVAQEALIYGLTRLPELRDPTSMGPWLKHITLSRCVDYRRRRGTRRLGECIDLLNEVAEEHDYAEGLTIRQALKGLSEAHRSALLLHYFGGWTVPDDPNALPPPALRSWPSAAGTLPGRRAGK